MPKRYVNIRFVSSWWLTASLLICLCASYVYLIRTGNPYDKWIYFIFRTRPGLILYLGLVANIISASARIFYAKLKKKNIDAGKVRGMDAFIELSVTGNDSLSKVAELIAKKGFSLLIAEKSLDSSKGKLSFLPGHIMRIGLVIFMISLIFSAYLRQSAEKSFHEGDEGSIMNEKVFLAAVESNLPGEFLQLGEKESFGAGNISTVLSIGSKTYKVSSGFPRRINGRYYRIAHIGILQPVSVTTPFAETSKKADLNILPPGKTDIVVMPPEDLLLTFTLEPEKTIKKGSITGKVFNIKSPSYRISVQKGKDKDISKQLTLRPQEAADVEGVNISLDKNSLFIRLQSVYDPALLWIYTGITITLLGMTLMLSRFFWYEKQVCAVLIDNKILIGYREEFYKKWGIIRFNAWKEELSALFSPPQ